MIYIGIDVEMCIRDSTYTAGSTQTEKKFDTIYYQLCY